MKRTNVHFPEQTLAVLKKLSDKTGLPVNELIRRAVDDYLKRARK
jgi:predicted DNA binding CopG/RHH family protein